MKFDSKLGLRLVIGLYLVLFTGYIYLTKISHSTPVTHAAFTTFSPAPSEALPTVPVTVLPTLAATLIPSLVPTYILTPTIISSPQPTVTPLPTLLPTSTPTPKPVSQQSITSGLYISQVNDYRASKGLSAVTEDPYTCTFAQQRAEEIATEFSHRVFEEKLQNHSFEYPSFSEVTENIAQTSAGNPVEMWVNSPTHAENMSKDTPYVCIRSSGGFYAYEGWKP